MGYKRKNQKTPGGRPAKLTPEVQEAILKVIRSGGTYAAAARYVGVTETTLYEWLAKGRDGLQPYATFAEAVEKARAEAEMKFVGVVRQAAESGTWQAAAWWLERRLPSDWALKQQLEHSGQVRIEFVDVPYDRQKPED